MATPIILNIQDVMTEANFKTAMRAYNTGAVGDVEAKDWVKCFLRGLLVMEGYEKYVKGLSAADVPIKGWTLKFYNKTMTECEAELDALSDAQACVIMIVGWCKWQDNTDLFEINEETSPQFMLDFYAEQERKRMLRAVAGRDFNVRRVGEW